MTDTHLPESSKQPYGFCIDNQNFRGSFESHFVFEDVDSFNQLRSQQTPKINK